MNIARSILAVVLGYATFVVSAVVLFKFSGIDPHSDPSIGVLILTIVYGLIFSFIGGLFVPLISKSRTRTLNYVLAAIIAAFAAFSFFKTTGNHYSQIAAIFLFAPASVIGGILYLKKISPRDQS